MNYWLINRLMIYVEKYDREYPGYRFLWQKISQQHPGRMLIQKTPERIGRPLDTQESSWWIWAAMSHRAPRAVGISFKYLVDSSGALGYSALWPFLVLFIIDDQCWMSDACLMIHGSYGSKLKAHGSCPRFMTRGQGGQRNTEAEVRRVV